MFAYLLAAAVLITAADVGDLRGTWKGMGRQTRYTLEFGDEALVAHVGNHPLLDARESRYAVDSRQGTIDIERSDGLQLGRYQVVDDKLTLTLADVNQPRPEGLQIARVVRIVPPFPRGTRYTVHVPKQYVFERQR